MLLRAICENVAIFLSFYSPKIIVNYMSHLPAINSFCIIVMGVGVRQHWILLTVRWNVYYTSEEITTDETTTGGDGPRNTMLISDTQIPAMRKLHK